MLAIRRERPELAPILNRLLVKEPVYRYQRTGDLVVDLAAVQRQLAGPKLKRWLDRAVAELPPRVDDGFFGDGGPPPSLPRKKRTTPGGRAPKKGLMSWFARSR
ncbi:MAG: hypothetical protein GY898_29960 [Proteobacteria bacterium]|nr:hypothetical protein [Pseudomonadota bacterium]